MEFVFASHSFDVWESWTFEGSLEECRLVNCRNPLVFKMCLCTHTQLLDAYTNIMQRRKAALASLAILWLQWSELNRRSFDGVTICFYN
ncbi:unnamed protein product [Camellia sinensis]